MDHEKLLEAISERFDDRTTLMRQDIKDLSERVHGFNERLVKVESEQGFIRKGFNLVLTLAISGVSYVLVKLFDLKSIN